MVSEVGTPKHGMTLAHQRWDSERSSEWSRDATDEMRTESLMVSRKCAVIHELMCRRRADREQYASEAAG